MFDTLLQLFVLGHPVPPERLALALQRPLDEVRAIVHAHPELEYDAQGTIVGSGLSLTPTTHQFQLDERTLFTWCAMDTLAYPIRLQRTARVTARCPATGRSIRLMVSPDQELELTSPMYVRGRGGY